VVKCCHQTAVFKRVLYDHLRASYQPIQTSKLHSKCILYYFVVYGYWVMPAWCFVNRSTAHPLSDVCICMRLRCTQLPICVVSSLRPVFFSFVGHTVAPVVTPEHRLSVSPREIIRPVKSYLYSGRKQC